MGNPRERPQHLAAKLLAIRQKLGLSQSEMVARLEFKVTGARISEYEHGHREPNLIILLRYAKSVDISVDAIIDDDLELFG
jgi:transcriptional regulator with XRE-family HTH domain